MKKELLFVVGTMLFMMVGTMLTACSNDDETVTSNPSATEHPSRQMPEQVNFIKTVTDVGYLRCDKQDNTWYIDAPYQGSETVYDGGSAYYLFDLPKEYQKEGLKVKATLDCYKFRHFDEKIVVNVIGGYDYYDAVLKQIEITE